MGPAAQFRYPQGGSPLPSCHSRGEPMPGYLRFHTIPASALLISLFACSTASTALAATHTPFLTLTSDGSAQYFARSVASGRDVNGDGYEDVLIGATLNGPGTTLLGEVLLYFGGPGMDSIPDLTIPSEPDYAAGNFGAYGTALVDVNGDGYADVVAGNIYGNSKGQVFVYFGGPAMDAIPDLVLSGTFTGELFGFAISSAGDLNGDGYEDLVLTGHVADSTGVISTRAYLYFGGPVTTANPTPNLILVGDPSGHQFGRTILGGRDLNGDGKPDLLIGDF